MTKVEVWDKMDLARDVSMIPSEYAIVYGDDARDPSMNWPHTYQLVTCDERKTVRITGQRQWQSNTVRCACPVNAVDRR